MFTHKNMNTRVLIHFFNTIIETAIVCYVFCLDVVQGRMNGTPKETRTPSERFASLTCLPFHNLRRPHKIEINLEIGGLDVVMALKKKYACIHNFH